MQKVKWLLDIIKKLIDDKFTGNIQVNFYQGGITNVTENRSYKPPAKSVFWDTGEVPDKPIFKNKTR